MKKKDFYGKYILGGSFLNPIEITEELCRRHKFLTKETLKKLYKESLIFDSLDTAKIAMANAISMIKGINDGTYVREEDLVEAYPPKKRIYISGPISGYRLGERRITFKKAQVYFEDQGYDVFNPMENGLPAKAATREHMKLDIEQLMTCNYIYMMRRWTHSKGCKVEFDVATAIGLPVIFEESKEIIEFE